MTDDTNAQDETMNNGLTAMERDFLQSRLRQMQDTMPPRAVWKRIVEQARAEGLLSNGHTRQGVKWLAGAAIAAAVALAVLKIPSAPPLDELPATFSDTPDYEQIAGNNSLTTLNALMVESRQLERDLRSLPHQRRVVRVGTEATITEVEDRVAAIDYRLNHPSIRLTRGQEFVYWNERVRLMNLLVNLRYAQAQRVAF